MIRNGTKRRMRLLLCGILFMGLLSFPLNVNGNSIEPEGPKVLVVFSSTTGEIDEHQRLLDMLISHFTHDITFKNSKEVKKEDFDKVTHLFYYGQVKEQLPNTFLELLQPYKGPFTAIGHNVEQLKSHFPFIVPEDIGTYTEVVLGDKHITLEPQTILKVKMDENTQVIVEAKQGENKYPLFMKQKDAYYYAADDLFPPISNFLAEALHEVFAAKHNSSTQAYLRLEDIHPGVEATFVMEIARILKQRNIPYMVSVVPVYVNPETEEEYHLLESPELIEALKFMQENGGSIIFHGYTDQYGTKETGDGFEFWNEERNSPIYQNPDDNTVMKTRESFQSQIDYENYLKTLETNYIKDRLNKGIQELVDYGLYPLAFEAPHYAMSQNGYEVVSHYFSTLIGQIQLSDGDWRKMTESPYVSSPVFLHGMTLLPETIRYVRYEDPGSVQEMKSRVNDFTAVRDGMIGGFYHPFLGAKGLIELLDELEKIPDLKWNDLKAMNNTIQTDTVSIKTENSMITVDLKGDHPASSMESRFRYYLLALSKDNVHWILAGAAVTFVMTFYSYFLFRRTTSIKKSWHNR